MASMLPEQRFHYMDNLRALAMLAGVVFHVGLAHSFVLHKYWPTADTSRSVVVDVLALFSHLFRMPLFFVVAGFFAALMVRKRGVAGMLRNRFARVLLPFIVFWPVLYWAMRWLTLHAAATVTNLSPLLVIVKQWMQTANTPPLPPSMMHLWFLAYLMCFCVLVWVVTALELKLVSWVVARTKRLAIFGPKLLLLLIPLLLVPALAGAPVPLPPPESFFLQWWALLFFGLYFFFGYQLFLHQSLLDQLKPFTLPMTVGALMAYAVFLWLMKIQSLHPSSALLHWSQGVLAAYSGVWMTLWCLSVGHRWLNHSNGAMRYVADASYWVYVVHLPIVFAIQYQLLDAAFGGLAKFTIALGGTLAIAFASYHVCVRNTLLGRLLNGKPKNRAID